MEKLVLDDFPIKNISEELQALIVNSLPRHMYGEILSWGFSDTVVRESIFELLLKRLGYSAKDYYNSELSKNYFEKGIELNEEQIKLICEENKL